MKKISCIALCALLFALTSSTGAQQPKKVPRIGYLVPDARAYWSRTEAFRQALRDLGYNEGNDIIIEYRFAEGKLDRLPEIATELVKLKVDVILTGGGPPTRAVKNATKFDPYGYDKH